MSKPLDVKGKTISQIARWYFDNQLYVNRTYQRKLVWSLDEKKLFIDSLLSRFPTPSIILNEVDKNEMRHYEIIDGMQRLDAILSFLLGNFPVDYNGSCGYFDKSAIAVVQKELQNTTLPPEYELLSLNDCLDFADVEIPVVICNQDEHNITDIFCRINSSGKKLSLHDLRQASVINDFSELVRRCSTHIRGDYTYTDIINLCDMRKISLSGKGLDYGINHEDVFWRRHQIITYDNLRQSRDEEIVASILANFLLDRTGHVNKTLLNKLYNSDSDECQAVISKIQCIGMENIEESFISTKSCFDTIFSSINDTFSNYLFSSKTTPGKDNIFQNVFQALLILCREGYVVDDYPRFANILKQKINTIFLKFVSGDKVSSNEVSSMYSTFYSALKDNMIKSISRDTTPMESVVKQRLSMSNIELSMTEFKIGILDFFSHRMNVSCMEKIAQTLVAMANTPCTETGYVIVGVANNKTSSDDWVRNYSQQPLLFGKHYVVGVEDEALSQYHDLDHYMQAIKDKFKSFNISEPLKQYILSNIQIINFENKTLLVFETRRTDSDSTYNGVAYIRNGNSTEKK